MIFLQRIAFYVTTVLLATTLAFNAAPTAQARSPIEIDASVDAALIELFRVQPTMRSLYHRAYATMVMPDIVKGGFIVGGSYGEGALVVNGRINSYWSFMSGSIGLQAGAQRLRQVIFFMTPEALDNFAANGTAIGAEAELTVIDAGGDLRLNSETAQQPVIMITYSRQGLLGGASLRGGQYQRLFY